MWFFFLPLFFFSFFSEIKTIPFTIHTLSPPMHIQMMYTNIDSSRVFKWNKCKFTLTVSIRPIIQANTEPNKTKRNVQNDCDVNWIPFFSLLCNYIVVKNCYDYQMKYRQFACVYIYVCVFVCVVLFLIYFCKVRKNRCVRSFAKNKIGTLKAACRMVAIYQQRQLKDCCQLKPNSPQMNIDLNVKISTLCHDHLSKKKGKQFQTQKPPTANKATSIPTK